MMLFDVTAHYLFSRRLLMPLLPILIFTLMIISSDYH